MHQQQILRPKGVFYTMLLHRKSVELLAPAGTWDAMTAGIAAGADAVYLGGKHFNMRLHEGDFNFNDELLKEAVDYAHARNVELYVTLNNLISNEELPALRDYLSYLNEIRPDAILVQDFAVLELVHEMGITVPLHTSVMMNTHNEHAIEKLKEYGITRIVVGREMTLSELALFRARTGIEVEYFMHGDMCISESGQCIHSGVLFGQSGNRGRCMKICRWPFALINEETGAVLDEDSPGPYKLALKDMCMYRSIPELIQAGVYSFKIEGRMRSPEFIGRLVSTYRRAIDAYIADPNGYATDEDGWRTLYDNRVRDYTTTFAFGQPTAVDIGMTGEREPRFFSQAVEEAGFADEVLRAERPIEKENAPSRHLSVRVGTVEAARAAIDAGADTIYAGGEAFRPNRPWKRADYEDIIRYAAGRTRIVINTPRTTMRRACGELEQFFTELESLGVDGIMVGNLGALKLARTCTKLPVQADHSFGSYESMICDYNFPAMSLPNYSDLSAPELLDIHYAFRDEADGVHPIRIDQYGRNHIYFAKDLCLYPYLEKFNGLSSYRIEAQDYTAEQTAEIVRIYRAALDRLAAGGDGYRAADFDRLTEVSPRPLGIGTYRFRQSRNSI